MYPVFARSFRAFPRVTGADPHCLHRGDDAILAGARARGGPRRVIGLSSFIRFHALRTPERPAIVYAETPHQLRGV